MKIKDKILKRFFEDTRNFFRNVNGSDNVIIVNDEEPSFCELLDKVKDWKDKQFLPLFERGRIVVPTTLKSSDMLFNVPPENISLAAADSFVFSSIPKHILSGIDITSEREKIIEHKYDKPIFALLSLMSSNKTTLYENIKNHALSTSDVKAIAEQFNVTENISYMLVYIAFNLMEMMIRSSKNHIYEFFDYCASIDDTGTIKYEMSVGQSNVISTIKDNFTYGDVLHLVKEASLLGENSKAAAINFMGGFVTHMQNNYGYSSINTYVTINYIGTLTIEIAPNRETFQIGFSNSALDVLTEEKWDDDKAMDYIAQKAYKLDEKFLENRVVMFTNIIAVINYLLAHPEEKVRESLKGNKKAASTNDRPRNTIKDSNLTTPETAKTVSLNSIKFITTEDKVIRVLNSRKYERAASCWGVRGHWRTLKSGKKVWIKSYEKGKDRNKGITKGKIYQV